MHDLNNILNESYKLEEGAKFGQKEVNDILSRSGDFNIGIEYEFNIDRKRYDPDDVRPLLQKGFGIEHIYSVVGEHDEMTEVITEKMNLKDAITNIKGMFKFLNSDLAEVRSFAGMHISISSNKYDMSDFNRSKFMVMLNSEYIHKLFPERRHVQDVSKIISNAMKQFKRYNKGRAFTEDTIDTIESIISDTLDTKYITATLKDFNMMDGRIELRFFGGENYQSMYADIKQQMLRALFIMELAYTDLYQKEYYKELYKFIKKDDSSIELDRKDKKDLFAALSQENSSRVLDILKRISDRLDPQETYEGLDSGMQKKIKNLFKKDPQSAFEFAEEVMRGKFEEGEPVIAENARTSYFYALLNRERFPEGEEKMFEELDLHEIEHYVHAVSLFNNYNKIEAIEMINNMPESLMENLVATVMDNRGEELTQEMGEKIFSLSTRSAEFAVEYLLNDSDVRNANTYAYTFNNAYLKTYETSLIDEEDIMERVRNEKSPIAIEDMVSNVYLSDEQSIEIIDQIYNTFKKVGLGIDEDGHVDMRVGRMISDTIANKSPTVKEYFENKIGQLMRE